MDAYDLILRALPHYRSGTPDDNAEAIRLFMRAMDLDPGYALAISFAASTLSIRWDRGWPPLTGDDFATSITLTRRAVALANGDPMILAQCGLTLVFAAAEYEEGFALVDLAVAGNPNNSFVMAYSANAYLHCGDIGRALEYAHRAVDLQPGRVGAYFPLTIIAHCHMALGAFEEALGSAERALAANPNFEPIYWMLIAANAKLGRAEEARRWVARFLRLRPEISIEVIRRSQPRRYGEERIANILEGLAIAGVPKG